MPASCLTKIILGATLTIFIGYCIYFDHKRHSDPCFQNKLKYRRKRALEQCRQKVKNRVPRPECIPNVQMYFLEQMSKGEQSLSAGHPEQSIVHFANAALVCPDRTQMMCVLRRSLPTEVYQELEETIQIIGGC